MKKAAIKIEKSIIKPIIDVLNTDPENKYYVYALCEQKNGKLIPFYIGKGEGGRVWSHESEYNSILQKMGYPLSSKNGQNLSKKLKKIGKAGSDIKRIIIKWGMSESEAFMAESSLINLLSLGNLSFDRENDELTNVANGHKSIGEKALIDCDTKARTTSDFYYDCALQPIEFDTIKDIILININRGYPDCLEKAKSGFGSLDELIKETVRGFWRVSDNKHPGYVYALYQGRIVGVYRVEDHGKSRPTILDVNNGDYPQNNNLLIRKNDRDLASRIVKHCGSIGKTAETIQYDDLPRDIKDDAKKSEFFANENEFKNWCRRKYFILKDIDQNDSSDKIHLDRIGHRVIITKGTSTESLFPGGSPIRYSIDL